MQYEQLNSINLFGSYDIRQYPSFVGPGPSSLKVIARPGVQILSLMTVLSLLRFDVFGSRCFAETAGPELRFFRCLSCWELVRQALSAIEWTESTVLGYEFRIVTR